MTGLARLTDKPVNGLSKGMKQRLCLGRAMIHDPAVLILDEPAAGLDPRARIELREILRYVAADGKTILVSSHILTELAEMCDVVGIIEQGRMLAVGTVEEIQRRTHSQHRAWLRLRVLENASGLAAWLAEDGDVHDLKTEGETAIFAHNRDRQWEAELLRKMVVAGFRVIEFGTEAHSLEDVFMQVTAGNVQ